MHEKSFAEAFNVPNVRVLGLRVRPYAIGHELALIRSENPLLTYAENSFAELAPAVQRTCLADAVEICCYRRPVSKWIWAIRCIKLDFEEEILKFRQYRISGSGDFPTVRQPRASGIPYHYFGAPELARLINYVSASHAMMMQTHFGSSPLNFPLGLAKMLWSAEMESSGAIWIENHHDAEERARRKAFEKLNPESGVAVGEEAVKEAARKWNEQNPSAPAPQ